MWRVCILILTWMIMTDTIQANDRYYMILFGSQDGANRPKRAHSFATFLRVSDSDDADTEATAPLEAHTISWLPASGKIVLLRLLSEPGKNYTLSETLAFCASQGSTVSAWGPFEVKKELYDMALKQITRLKSERLGFLAIDNLARGNGATNCIHAISDLDTTQPPLATGTARGNPATEMIVEHFRRWIVDSNTQEAELIEKLKLKDADIEWLTKAKPRP